MQIDAGNADNFGTRRGCAGGRVLGDGLESEEGNCDAGERNRSFHGRGIMQVEEAEGQERSELDAGKQVGVAADRQCPITGIMLTTRSVFRIYDENK